MVDYKEHILPNGLHLIVHEDHNTPLVCLNILYKVGSRNERPDKTGFAHLFEHLMFGGSKHVKNFDEPLQAVGGENNAFTNTDITNYYVTVPAPNAETAFWLESDRMLSLSFDPEVLEVQRKVVIEEFKQRYLNQPYGDVWLKLRPVAYEKHPYQWPTIGKEISHIEEATMDDVKSFFKTHYHPGNAVLVVAGDITEQRALELTEKWFGEIPAQEMPNGQIAAEPDQLAPRKLKVTANVPADALYKAYHMGGRMGKAYHAADLLSDLLGRGKSSVLFQELVKNKPMFSSLSAYVMGSYDPGLLVISGKLLPGVDIEEADRAIQALLEPLKDQVDADALEKVKNQAEATTVFAEVDLLNRAMGLAYAAFLGDTNLINDELELIKSIQTEDICAAAKTILREDNCTTLYYQKNEQ
ncbi:M16 family metallopeptidase [Marinoscillum furvescens]|uniref:Zinc protease n=1 Tax=Marinoscillum furvescens DSM 4134 TaxID=1122208 RepID=A0A3D9L2P8_MARFU|nr:pitrilysin family protein [Marinoscillum furvescens]RED98895.1 zinc protease [Marinoscillum furvescens DSM 4134]